MTDCVFCKIVQGKIPCCKVYEDSTILAFMDISPINVGHVLIIPKKHCESLIESGDKILQAMLPVAAMIVNSLKRVNNKSINTKEEAWKKQVVKADAVNLLLSDGKEAGQEVPHVHLHVIPRFANDGFSLKLPKNEPKNPDRSALQKIADAIRIEL